MRLAVAAVRSADAVIFSDYNYGAADTEIFEAVRAAAAERGISLLVDSRFRLQDFRGASSATPNQDEVEQILGPGFGDADCDRLRDELGLESLLVTNGNKGMTLIERGRQPQHIDAVGSDQAVDVTGAGDTVIAKDLTIDSLAIMDMVMELEDRFDVSIPMNVVAEIHTVDQLADTILKLHARR